MLEFDESEYLPSAVSDRTLILVVSLFPNEPDVKDRLLYRGEANYRLTGSPASVSERGVNMVLSDCDCACHHEDMGQQTQKARECATG